MKIIKHGTLKEISFKCTYCQCEWTDTISETIHTVAKNNSLLFDQYRMKCPECGRDTTETISRSDLSSDYP